MDKILTMAQSSEKTAASFSLIYFMYYLGALIVIGAMGMFMTFGMKNLRGLFYRTFGAVRCTTVFFITLCGINALINTEIDNVAKC
jgi:cytochrome c biogenesis protein CcdA